MSPRPRGRTTVPKTAARGRTTDRNGGRKAHPKNGPRTTTKAAKAKRTKNVKKATKATTAARPRSAASGAPAATIAGEALRGGQGWSRRLRAGEILRIVDVTGHGCVSALFYNAREPLERYNMADTLKAQHTAFLTAGRVLYSDMGRILASIIADACGWHDTISGCGDAAAGAARFGSGGYQELRNDFHRNARDNFLVELSKVGLGKRDVVANVNFFVRVAADDSGQIRWVPRNSHPGAVVELRFEMDTLVVLSNTPHPLDPSSTYAPPPVQLAVRPARGRERSGPRDPCRLSRPENARGFALTEVYRTSLEPLS
jgi:urea carboxylase-associated protein 2